MRAVVFRDGELGVGEVEQPTPGRGQVLVRTLANGICGSDLHALEQMRADPGAADPNTVMGHEFCAEVVDYGPSTDAPYAVGSWVCANPFTDAGGLVNPGGLAEYMALDVDRLLAAPAGVTAEHAALTEPLAVGIRSVAMARYRAASGAYVVVGCGPIGLAVIAALRADGLGPIVAADLSSARLAIAEKLGADVLVDATNDNAFAHLGDRGFTPAPLSPMLAPGTDDDLGATIFDCVGAVGMFKRILGGAPPHSHIVFAGICGHDDTYRPMLANVKEVTVSYVLAYRPEELAIAAQRIADGKIDADSFITATVGLDEAPWAFDALSRAEHAKIVVDPTR